MPSLHELQRAFARAMLAGPADEACGAILDDGIAAAERLRVHRNTFRANLARTLRMTYPAVDKLVGEAFFDAASETFIARHPPHSADLNEYGACFPEFLDTFPAACGVPYLADVARFEWALNVAAHGRDTPTLAAAHLLSIEPNQHARLRFVPHPSVTLLALTYPADEIADAVLAGDDAAIAAIDLSGGMLHVIVYRGARGVEAQRLTTDAHRFLLRLHAGEPLGALLEDTRVNVPALLADALDKGRLTALRIDP